MYLPETCKPSSVAIIALTMLAGLLVVVASDLHQTSTVSVSATMRAGTCFRPQTTLAMSPGGTLQQVFQFYVPCRDSFDVNEKGFLAFPEA